MPKPETVAIPLAISVPDARSGQVVDLRHLHGVQIIVAIRHRY